MIVEQEVECTEIVVDCWRNGSSEIWIVEMVEIIALRKIRQSTRR